MAADGQPGDPTSARDPNTPPTEHADTSPADQVEAPASEPTEVPAAEDEGQVEAPASESTEVPTVEGAESADDQVGTSPSDGSEALEPPGGPPTAPPGPPRRRRAGRIVLGVLAFMLMAFVVGASFVPLPYYLFKPGSVRDTEPLIEIEGAEVFPSDGSIGYTTVSLRQATLFGLIQGWIDDDIDTIGRDEVLQGRDVDENRELNLQAMTNAKQVATQVALERLGYEVDVTVGQFVTEVDEGFPASGVIEPGEIIVSIEGETFDDENDLTRLLEGKVPGDTVTVGVQSPDGTERDVELELAPSTEDPERGVMGVRVQPVALAYEFPFDVTIDTGDVGGPSAGLAFTLALIDDLTPGDLTGGGEVAVTGTISGDGTVGPVGGTGQKAAAVRDEGITLFIVPTQDYEEAVARAGDDLQVVPVDNVDEALDALRERGGNVDDLPPPGEAAAATTG